MELAWLLGEAADSLFGSSVGDGEPFWETRNATWRRYQAVLAAAEVEVDELVEADRTVVLHTIVGASIDAVARSGGRVTSALAHAGAALAIERDLIRLRADLPAPSTTPSSSIRSPPAVRSITVCWTWPCDEHVSPSKDSPASRACPPGSPRWSIGSPPHGSPSGPHPR